VIEHSLTSVKAGSREALPIVFGYLPIAFAYGVLGRAAGIPLWGIVFMSVIVFAGSAQFIAVSLLDQGASAVTLVVTTLLVNLRHLLYSSALVPWVRGEKRGRLAWVAAELTDESFVLLSRVGEREGHLRFPFIAGLQGAAQLTWVVGSVIGGTVGSLVRDPVELGLDYALIAMFLGLLALQIRKWGDLVVAGVASVVSISMELAGADSYAVIVATLLAAGAGFFFNGAVSEEEEEAG